MTDDHDPLRYDPRVQGKAFDIVAFSLAKLELKEYLRDAQITEDLDGEIYVKLGPVTK